MDSEIAARFLALNRADGDAFDWLIATKQPSGGESASSSSSLNSCGDIQVLAAEAFTLLAIAANALHDVSRDLAARW